MEIKVGDIFYNNYYNSGLASFYQVVKVYISGRVRIRRNEEKEIEWINGYEKKVMPDINNFCKKGGFIIKDNSKGTIKKVDFSCSSPSIDLGRYAGWLWDGEPIISSYYYVWMK